jgi:preprotein translocase subunit SecA
LETLGYFESEEVRAQVLSQPLSDLRRDDLDALAVRLGQARLDTLSSQRLGDLPQEERESVLAHLQAHDWFLDKNRLHQVQAQSLRDLEDGIRDELVETLRRQQLDHLRQQRLETLGREQRYTIHQILQEQGIAPEEGQMRPLRRQRVSELDQDVYTDLLRELGEQVADAWTTSEFRDLDDEQKAILSAYLGRRIMSRIERRVLLHTISRLWIDYLTDIEDLRRGIGLEAYGQRDPLIEYKRRAFELFEELGDNIRRTVARSLFRQPPEPLGA